MSPQLIVVGAGLFGLTVAREAAERHGLHVLVLDRRSHLGGNAWSEADPETGIEVHRYGPHFFHTNNERVWTYLNRFTAFTPFSYRGQSNHRGEIFPLPVNLATINQFYRAAMSPDEARARLREEASMYQGGPATNFEDKAISLIGRPLYEAFFKGYTTKQWQTDLRLLPAETLTRLPIRYTYDNRWFNDKYQAQPADGYAAWMRSMADHPRIEVRLGVDFLSPTAEVNRGVVGRVPVVYTGPVDEYFGDAEGRLSWRTLDFHTEVHPTGDFQGTAIVNYADVEVPWTRIVEYRHVHPERDYPADRTVTVKEFSRFADTPGDEPYYPVNAVEDRARLTRYRARMEAEPLVWFGGRLGTYQYLDMHMAVAAALSLMDNKLSPYLQTQTVGDPVAS
ncbi:UDP-galactopyranose mutase [Kineococcus gynurae]|uniref:UDP-galactopyranose mutase n=1 Tax=Kineococcus gynurae TaxID=452979 RepID=A0ABV5LXI0_9ACTN